MAAAPFFYLYGDPNKTPVDLSEQVPNTLLIRVNARGRESTYTVGVTIKNDDATRIAAWKAAMDANLPETL